MLAARLFVRFGSVPSSVLLCTGKQNPGPTFRFYASKIRTRARAPTFKEQILRPATPTPFGIGKGVLIGASAVALGSLVYYGLGLSKDLGAIDTHMTWPSYVKDRIRSTYVFFAGSVAITAASAFLMSQSPALIRIFSMNSIPAFLISMAACVGSLYMTRSIKYNGELGMKHVAWIFTCSLIGGTMCPLVLLGGPLLVKAAWYTVGVIGGLSTLAACAPSDKFLYMGAPLFMGLGAVIVSSIGTAFFPVTSLVGASLYSFSVFGGLVVFGGFLLYDTQKIIDKAKRHPLHGAPYDPINASLGIYIATINMFESIIQILLMNGKKNK